MLLLPLRVPRRAMARCCLRAAYAEPARHTPMPAMRRDATTLCASAFMIRCRCLMPLLLMPRAPRCYYADYARCRRALLRRYDALCHADALMRAIDA